MRTALLASLACLILASCEDGLPPGPAPNGRLAVRVHWQEVGVPGRRLELPEIGATRITDRAGLAEFIVPAADYVLRAHEINIGGPPPPFLEYKATVRGGETTRIDVVDCLPCVAPVTLRPS